MIEFFLALFGVPFLLIAAICEYSNSKKRDLEIQKNSFLYKTNVAGWLYDVVDIEYENDLREYYSENGGSRKLWEDAKSIICQYIDQYRLLEYPPPKSSFTTTLCYVIIMSYNKGKLPERVAKRGMPVVNYACFKDKSMNNVLFSQTMWWVGEQLKMHGVDDNIVISHNSTYKYLTLYNKDAANKGIFKWERMIYPAFTINDSC